MLSRIQTTKAVGKALTRNASKKANKHLVQRPQHQVPAPSATETVPASVPTSRIQLDYVAPASEVASVSGERAKLRALRQMLAAGAAVIGLGVVAALLPGERHIPKAVPVYATDSRWCTGYFSPLARAYGMCPVSDWYFSNDETGRKIELQMYDKPRCAKFE